MKTGNVGPGVYVFLTEDATGVILTIQADDAILGFAHLTQAGAARLSDALTAAVALVRQGGKPT